MPLSTTYIYNFWQLVLIFPKNWVPIWKFYFTKYEKSGTHSEEIKLTVIQRITLKKLPNFCRIKIFLCLKVCWEITEFSQLKIIFEAEKYASAKI